MTSGDTQKSSGGTTWRAAALFPILYRIDRYIEQLRELLLRQIDRPSRRNSEQLLLCINPALSSRLHLLHGFEQLSAFSSHPLLASHGQSPL
jgi:hypothetical protein